CRTIARHLFVWLAKGVTTP
ncbi:sporulation related domain protein, partial [Vibrio parahaemolyticus V-223/04]